MSPQKLIGYREEISRAIFRQNSDIAYLIGRIAEAEDFLEKAREVHAKYIAKCNALAAKPLCSLEEYRIATAHAEKALEKIEHWKVVIESSEDSKKWRLEDVSGHLATLDEIDSVLKTYGVFDFETGRRIDGVGKAVH